MQQDNRPVQEIELHCDLLERQEPPQAPAASLVLNVHAQYEVLLISSLSRGSGEMTAALNVLPFTPQGTRVLYGAGAGSTVEQRNEGRAQIRRLMGLPVAQPDEWQWEVDGRHFRPLHLAITPGTRPLLVLAPHGYSDRELNLARGAAVPAGSVVVSWSPLGYPNPDLADHGVKLWTAARLGYRSSKDQHALERLHEGSIYSVVPPAPQFQPAQVLSPSETFAVEAFNLSRQNNNRLACFYGHGTTTNPTHVLTNFLTAAKAGTRDDRWAVVVVIHHATDEENGLSKPASVAAAVDNSWVPGPGVAGNAASGTWTCEELHIKIFHLKGLEKQCMDWLFGLADLPVVEGANSVVQLMSAGRPFLRTSKGDDFLGSPTNTIVADCGDSHENARADLAAASQFLSGLSFDDRGPEALRALLFTTARRRPMDEFAAYLSARYFTGENDPLTFIPGFLTEVQQSVPMVNNGTNLTFGD